MDSDWRNGFLFVGNHLALDFVNTRPVVHDDHVELISGGPALANWLEAAGLVTTREAARLMRKWSAPEFAAAVESLRHLRESFRRGLFQIEAGDAPSAAFVKDLNRLLLDHPSIDQIVHSGAVLERKRRFAPETPEDASAPLADAMVDLLTLADRTKIRKCINADCVLHYYDTSKKGTREWCSMRMCGNRAKVAAFAERQRAAARLNEA